MTETAEAIKIQRGLKGVYFDRSPCTFIDGRAGELRYRGYSIHDLAEQSSFEETAWLLLHGELPSKAELAGFDAELKSARKLPAPVIDIVRLLKAAHPMDVLRTAVSALAGFDPQTSDNSREATLRKGVRLTAQVPMIVAAHARIRAGLDPLPADASLGQAANLLWMLRGEKPSADAAALIDRDLILHAEHGSNASSFAARVVIGTEANLHAALTAAIAALSGPAHGGAAEDVMKMAEEIGDPARAADYVRDKRKGGVAVTGFGHRVYRAEDPRARVLRRVAQELGSPRFEAAAALEHAALTELRTRRPDRPIETNVEFWAAMILDLAAVPAHMFAAMFTCARVAGWSAHVLEEKRTGRLIRPSARYIGPGTRPASSVEGWEVAHSHV